ncbi:recombinase RecT [Methylobacterium hispanicum]|uniref:recombinase RecT n=1 Tax=Methylobacterium hispanicum TaxID=270350 RepID=UPI002F3420A4
MSNALALTETERRIAERIDPNAATDVTVSAAAGGLAFHNMSQMMEFARYMVIAKGGIRKHLRGDVGACLAICTQAVEWGMSPYAVANKSYFVNDQIAFESQLVQAVILKRAPIKGRIKFEFTGTGEKRICRAWARLAEDPDEVVEYVSPEFAKITPKNSPLWKSDPDQQHAYYSGRALCRRHFPDVLLGVYADDELAPEPPAGPDTARDVTPPKGLNARLDALAGKPAAEAALAAADTFVEPATEANRTDGFAGLGEYQASTDEGGDEAAELAINRQSPDYLLGYEGGIQGMRKGLTADIKADAARLAHFEAGQADGRAEAAREREEA